LFPDEKTMAGRYARFNETASKSFSGTSDPCRAMMEGVAMQVKKRIDELDKAGLHAERIVMVGGPTGSAVWTNILKDTLKVDIETPEIGAYAGAIGAAIMAMKGITIGNRQC
jgi:sugar (pentulose or hexulose) kinase